MFRYQKFELRILVYRIERKEQNTRLTVNNQKQISYYLLITKQKSITSRHRLEIKYMMCF